MGRFLISRGLQSAVVLAVMSFVVYGLIGLMPGDPIYAMLASDPNLTPEDVTRLLAVYGLDQPLIDRYLAWAAAALQGDFGYSRLFNTPVVDALLPALWNTLVLLGSALLVALAVGLPLGVIAAAHKGRIADYAANFFAFAGISVPSFWLAIVLILVFAVGLGWFPAGGTAALSGVDGSGWHPFAYLILPVVSLALASAGGHTRYMRAAMIETLRQDYIRTARAKGLSGPRVVIFHGLRNAMIPVATIIALDFGFLLSGALVTETVFAYPGMGKLIFDAILGNDFNLALIGLMGATFVTLAGNLVADAAYAWLDPRLTFNEITS